MRVRLGIRSRIDPGLQGYLDLLEPGDQKLAGMVLLLRFRERFVELIYRPHDAIDEPLDEFLHVPLGLGWRGFVQDVSNGSNDLAATRSLAVEFVQQRAEFVLGDPAEPFELQEVRRSRGKRSDSSSPISSGQC